VFTTISVPTLAGKGGLTAGQQEERSRKL